MKRKILIIMFCIGLVFGLTASSSAKHYHYSKKTICWVQKGLKGLGFYQGKITGVMDNTTINAIKAFQKEKGLKVDGIPGPKTRAALKKSLKGKKSISMSHKKIKK